MNARNPLIKYRSLLQLYITCILYVKKFDGTMYFFTEKYTGFPSPYAGVAPLSSVILLLIHTKFQVRGELSSQYLAVRLPKTLVQIRVTPMTSAEQH